MQTTPTTQSEGISAKHQRLVELIRPMERVLVAFSAGVDSTLVLKVALETLGRENVLAVTGISPSLPQRELQSVKDLAAILQSPLQLIETSEMESENYTSNPSNRCYFCKTELYSKLSALAQSENYQFVLNGLNLDDTGDHRPGMVAAKEWNIRSPLLEASLTKSDIRALANQLALPNW